jgi:POT family proton-dependent oligopeptide transporter
MQTLQTNHPPSLRVFFATEMWERYGFYVVQTLLALYLVSHFKWPDKQVYALVGSFTALTYLSPLVGGWIADHLLGQKRTILTGAVVLLFSYLSLGLTASDDFLSLSLAGIAVGTGLLKPNISSLLGNEYPVGSPHRENGFMIFYMGLTTGIILGTTLPSYLNDHLGWSASFLSAVIGMMMAIGVFSWGIYQHRIEDYHPYVFSLKNMAQAVLIMTVLWLLSFYILKDPHLADAVFLLLALFSVGYFIYCIKGENALQSRQTIVLGMLCLISVMFWAFYFQMFLSFTLFIARAVRPMLFGIHFPPPFYVGIQSIGMILLGILLVRRKKRLNVVEQSLRASNQFLCAMYSMTAAYALIVFVCQMSAKGGLLSPLYIIPAYLIISLAEMLLSPVGLSAVTLLASRKKVSTLMGIFLASLGVGAYLSGKLASLTAVPDGFLSTLDLGAHYAMGFTYLLYILVGATLVCIGLNYLIKGMMTLKS